MVIPRTALLARSSSITNRRTSPCTCFHDHGASLTRASSPSSHISPIMCYSFLRTTRTGRSRRVFSVRRSLVAIVGPHTGAREGTIQKPARGGHSRRPNASPSRGARHCGARQCPPSGAGRHPGSQHGSHPCTGVQEAWPGVRFPSSPPPFRGLHQTSIVTQEGTGRAERHHCHRRETGFRLATVIGWRRRVQPRSRRSAEHIPLTSNARELSGMCSADRRERG